MPALEPTVVGERSPGIAAAPAVAPDAPATTEQPDFPPLPSGPVAQDRRPVILAGLGIGVVIALIGVVLVLSSGGESTGESTGAVAGADVSADGSDATGATPGGSEDTADADGTEEGAAQELDATFEAGDYVRLASMRTARRAGILADEVRAEGIDAIVISSEDAEELLPGFQVVVAGPVGSSEEARSIRSRARRAGITDAFVDPLTPAQTSLDPADLEGSWSGEPAQQAARRAEDNRDLPTEITIDSGGTSGSVEYPDIPCSATLTLSEVRGTTALYRESITSGSCLDGGIWRLKWVGDRLGVTWRMPDRKIFVAGYLER